MICKLTAVGVVNTPHPASARRRKASACWAFVTGDAGEHGHTLQDGGAEALGHLAAVEFGVEHLGLVPSHAEGLVGGIVRSLTHGGPRKEKAGPLSVPAKSSGGTTFMRGPSKHHLTTW